MCSTSRSVSCKVQKLHQRTLAPVSRVCIKQQLSTPTSTSCEFIKSEDDNSFDDQPEAPRTSEDDKEWPHRQERDMASDVDSEDKPTTEDSQQAQWPFGDSLQGGRRSGNKWQDKRDSRDTQEGAPSGGQQDQTQTSSTGQEDQGGSQDSNGQVDDADLRFVLDTHNRYRARHGTPPLSWSPRIAASAQAYSKNCVFEHSHAKGLGENLSSGHRDWAAAIKAWMEDEEGLYDHSRPGFAKATGHYTQVVWRSTTELGCDSSPCGGRPLYVCQYSPQGNIIGDFEGNVPAPSS